MAVKSQHSSFYQHVQNRHVSGQVGELNVLCEYFSFASNITDSRISKLQINKVIGGYQNQ